MPYKYNPFTGELDATDISGGGVISTQFDTDSGSAVPAANILNVLGGANLQTSGSGNTVTIETNTKTDGAVLVGNGTGEFTEIGPLTDGQLLIGDTAGVDPVAGSLTQPAAGITITGGSGTITFALADDLAAVEALSGSGVVTRTGVNTWATNSIPDRAVVVGDAGNTVQGIGPLSDGELLIGDTGGDPVAANLTAGTGISISNAAGSITINATGSGFTWNNVTGTSDTLVANEGFIANNAGLVTLTLPATAAIGDVFAIVGNGAGGWSIAQNAGQTIHLLGSDTTTGAGGSLSSTTRYDTCELICTATNTDFVVKDVNGNLTVV